MQADFEIHGGWGHHIEWLHPDQFNTPITKRSRYAVYGHLPIIPRRGQTLMGEFQHSFIKFRFVKVRRQSDLPDMFFAMVKPIEQEIKSESGG